MGVLRLIDVFQGIALYVSSIVITKYAAQGSADQFIAKCDEMGIRTYKHYKIAGYPSDVDKIVSDDGYGRNEYIETTRPLVVVTAPGPGSGKMATCLSQLYHDHKRRIDAGYAKFETFPIWNLALNHPVNLAYEAATADLDDVNMIDPFHLEAYGETTVNYNRDIEVFPVLNAMFEKISGSSPYKSPTDMGVNMAGKCIFDDEAVSAAANQEIIRRYYQALCEYRKGNAGMEPVRIIELLMNKAGISPADRPVVAAANLKAEQTGGPAAAMELPDGKILTGKTSVLLGASSALLINALKELAGIEDSVELIPPDFIEPIMKLKSDCLGDHSSLLHLNEILIALSVTAVNNENARKALEHIPDLKGCEAHSSVILSQVDETVFKKLGVNLTCEAHYESQKLYHK